MNEIATAEPDARGRGIARRPAARILVAMSLVIAVVSGGWLLAGDLRAESLARDYFSHAHGAATVANVSVESVSPAIPPFWAVRIGGDVIEAGTTTPAYRSYMTLWVEPFTGFVFVNGAG